MTEVQAQRIEFLTRGPVLRTLRGTRARIELMNWDDLLLLLRHFGCGIEELDYRLWQPRRTRLKHPRTIEEGETR